MSESINVLIIEDNPADAHLQKMALRNILPMEYKVRWTADLGSGCEQLQHESYDIVLLDLGLPESVGLDTLKAVRTVNDTSAVVVLSGADDERLALLALELGAEDYLPKSEVTPQTLHRTINHAIRRRQIQLAAVREQTLLARRFEAVLNAVPAAILILDAGGVVLDCNRRAAETYAWGRDDAAGRSISERVCPASGNTGWAVEALAAAQSAEDRTVTVDQLVVEGGPGAQRTVTALVVAEPLNGSVIFVCILTETVAGGDERR